MAMDLVTYLPLLSIVFSSMGVSFVFKDYIADLIATMVMKYNRDIRIGNRIKVSLIPGVVKGDVMDIGILRTTVMEVGDGERLPSVRTGRLIKIPNYLILSNAVMIYGDTIIDEVVSYVPRPFPDSTLLIQSMRQAIISNGHGLIDIGLYQTKDDKLAIHGVFETKTSEMGDQRSKILLDYLTLSRQFARPENAEAPLSEEPAVHDNVAIPLQNIERNP